MSESNEFSGEFYRQDQKNIISFREQRASIGVFARELRAVLKSFVGQHASEETVIMLKIAILHALQELMPGCKTTIKFDVNTVEGVDHALVLTPMNGFTAALFSRVPRL